MQDYEVIIIGAGPAGSYSALCCANLGLKTLLLDRQPFPRDKPCGGILEGKYFTKYASFLIWCYSHKLTSPQWERFFLRHAFPMV